MEGELSIENGKTLFAGDFFGEKALFKELPSLVSIKSLKSSQILTLERKEFEKLTFEFPRLGKKLLSNYIEHTLQDYDELDFNR